MKKKLSLILLCVFFGAVCANAQVRMGGVVAPSQSVVLDLNPTNTGTADKAFVLPRVNLEATTTQTLAEVFVGMTVYNVATANDVTPGIYYWDGSKWVRITSKLGDIINYIEFGDSIAQYIHTTNLGDTIMNFITNYANKELTDSIMKFVNIDGEYGITVDGSGTSDITIGLPAGNTKGDILVWNGSTWVVSSPNAVIKRLEIAIDTAAKDSIQSRILAGISTTSAKDIQIISVRPDIITTGVFDEGDLNISTSAKVVGNAINWTVRITNENYVGTRKYGVEKVVVYYLCEDVLNSASLNSRKYTQAIISVKTFE